MNAKFYKDRRQLWLFGRFLGDHAALKALGNTKTVIKVLASTTLLNGIGVNEIKASDDLPVPN